MQRAMFKNRHDRSVKKVATLEKWASSHRFLPRAGDDVVCVRGAARAQPTGGGGRRGCPGANHEVA